jgi:hypothetical protein
MNSSNIVTLSISCSFESSFSPAALCSLLIASKLSRFLHFIIRMQCNFNTVCFICIRSAVGVLANSSNRCICNRCSSSLRCFRSSTSSSRLLSRSCAARSRSSLKQLNNYKV